MLAITLVERDLILGALGAERKGGLAPDRACYQGALQCLAAFLVLFSFMLVKSKGAFREGTFVRKSLRQDLRVKQRVRRGVDES